MKKILWAVLLLFTLSVNAFAMEQGAYSVYCGTNYYNPDTGEIDDGGTANAALGEGMCRSATSTEALVEFDGTNYYVTIRLLLQSNTKDAIFWKHTGYNTYEEVNYEIMIEDAGADSVDYRFQVDDPFAPIKASMYVTPMGRSTVWYIELDESSLSSDTGDFVVSVAAALPEELVEPTPEEPVEEEIPASAETPEVGETLEVEDTLAEEEITEGEEEITEGEEEVAVGTGLDQSAVETPEVTEPPEVTETPEEETPIVGSDALVAPLETTQATTEVVATSNTGLYVGIAVAVIVVAGIAVVVVKKGKK